MSIEDVIFKESLEPDKMQSKVIGVWEYIKKTGGGILWAVLYWLVYGFFAYEVITIQEKIDYMILGIVIFFGIGLFLTAGVYLHLKFIRRYRDNIGIWLEKIERDKNSELEYKEKEYLRKKESCDLSVQENIREVNSMKDNLRSNIRTLYKYRDSQQWPDTMNELWDKVYNQVEK